MGQAISNEDNLFQEFSPHSKKQNEAIWSAKPIVVCATGIQWGKTTVGAVKMMMDMHKFSSPRDNFLVLAPTYKIMKQSTLPAFLQAVHGMGELHKGDMEFKVNGGGTVYLRTGTDPDSIVGATNVRSVWGDEAGLYSLYFWENMQARAAFKQAQITLTTSPYTLNWIFKELIRPKIKDPTARPDVFLVRARSDENPYFPKEYYEQKKKTMDPRRFQMMFGGEWSKFHGLVYDCFDEDKCTVEPFDLPPGTEVVAGVDWGTTHPFAVHVRAILPDGKQYQIGEHYETGLTITGMIDICRRFKKVYNIERFFCDPAQPGYILEFCNNGLTAIGATNDIRLGIDRHYALLKEGRLRLFRGMCPYSIDEYETYRYPDDDDTKGPNQDIKERTPVKQNDHALDAARYVSVHTYRHMDLKPYIIQDKNTEVKVREHEDHSLRIERLKRPKQKHFEEWS